MVGHLSLMYTKMQLSLMYTRLRYSFKEKSEFSCYRCKSLLVDNTPKDLDEINFYVCPSCASHYAKELDEGLHDRWMMPISLPLERVICVKDPASKAKETAFYFSIGYYDLQLDLIKKHIESELSNPCQKVSEIHDFLNPDEIELRKFLRGFLIELEKLRNE